MHLGHHQASNNQELKPHGEHMLLVTGIPHVRNSNNCEKEALKEMGTISLLSNRSPDESQKLLIL